jgi:hypothetical protein
MAQPNPGASSYFERVDSSFALASSFPPQRAVVDFMMDATTFAVRLGWDCQQRARLFWNSVILAGLNELRSVFRRVNFRLDTSCTSSF